MKKVMRCMCMMALVALAFTSCKKKEEGKTTFRAATQEFVIQSEDGERAYIDANKKIHFEVGDMCMLFNLSEANPMQSASALYEAVEDGNYVLFEESGYGEVPMNALDGGFYCYYPGGPANVRTELNDGENKAKFHLAPVQTYREGMVGLEAMYMAAKDDAATNLEECDFQMSNICGILQLKPYEAAQRTITSIEIVDNAFDLTGWCELILPELDPDEMQAMFDNFDMSDPSYAATLAAYLTRIGYNVTDKGQSVTLDIPGGVQLKDNKTETPVFNIVLRPLALSQGCHIIFTFDDTTTKDVDLSAINLMIKPNVIKPVSLNMDNY